jgi:L-rhamnose mutarotase
MRVFAKALDLDDDPARIAEYTARHRAVWPEVTEGLRRIGIRSMRIFRGGNRLFMTIETDDDFDPARYQDYASDPRTREWDALMRGFQRPAPFARPGEWWTDLEEVFDLAWFPPSRATGGGSAACGAEGSVR